MDSDDRTEQVQWLESEAEDIYDCYQATVSDYGNVAAFAQELADWWEQLATEDGDLPEWYNEHDYQLMKLMIEMIANRACLTARQANRTRVHLTV